MGSCIVGKELFIKSSLSSLSPSSLSIKYSLSVFVRYSLCFSFPSFSPFHLFFQLPPFLLLLSPPHPLTSTPPHCSHPISPFLLFSEMLVMGVRALCRLGKCSTTELCLQCAEAWARVWSVLDTVPEYLWNTQVSWGMVEGQYKKIESLGCICDTPIEFLPGILPLCRVQTHIVSD